MFPTRITTERLVLRPWVAADAPLLKDAVDSSLAELRPWMPWAYKEPSTVEEIADRFVRFTDEFEHDGDWHYGILNPGETEALGSTGIHRRVGPGGLEIGYWIRTSVAGRGYATEAAAAVTRTAFEVPWVEFVEIRCDPNNLRSARIPERLGYTLVDVLKHDTVTPTGAPRDTMVWRVMRGEMGEGY